MTGGREGAGTLLRIWVENACLSPGAESRVAPLGWLDYLAFIPISGGRGGGVGLENLDLFKCGPPTVTRGWLACLASSCLGEEKH